MSVQANQNQSVQAYKISLFKPRSVWFKIIWLINPSLLSSKPIIIKRNKRYVRIIKPDPNILHSWSWDTDYNFYVAQYQVCAKVPCKLIIINLLQSIGWSVQSSIQFSLLQAHTNRFVRAYIIVWSLKYMSSFTYKIIMFQLTNWFHSGL